jgi:hypothetical protein
MKYLTAGKKSPVLSIPFLLRASSSCDLIFSSICGTSPSDDGAPGLSMRCLNELNDASRDLISTVRFENKELVAELWTEST